MIYVVRLTKAMLFTVEASTADEASALAIAVALGHGTAGVRERVTFGGKAVRIEACTGRAPGPEDSA